MTLTIQKLGATIRFAAVAIMFASTATLVPKDLPNIVITYADDLGFGDLSCYNPDAAHRTPRLDRKASEGIRFTDAHSPTTICSPSRYGLCSGQHVFRTDRGSRAFEGPGGPSYIKPGELTIADIVKKHGYWTRVFGKWHVGLTWKSKDGKTLDGGFKNSLLIDYEKGTPLIDGPNQRGFDESFVTPIARRPIRFASTSKTAWSRFQLVKGINETVCPTPEENGDGTPVGSVPTGH